MKQILLIFLFISLCASSPDAFAEVFQYFDENGTLVVTDDPFGTEKNNKHTNMEISKESIPPDTRPIELRSGLIEDVLYDYYPVDAMNYHEAVISAGLNGPYDEQEKKNYAAQTTWKLAISYKFDYTYKITGSQLNISANIYDVEFKSYITVLLPSLSVNSALSADDMRQWNSFLKGLLEHEHDHVRIVRKPSIRDEALEKISYLKEFSFNYDTSSNIDELARSAMENETAKIGSEMSRKVKKLNDDYDKLTDHGLKPEMRDAFF